MDNTTVYDSEIFARWLYRPRFIDENNKLNERFISLRVFSGRIPEKGVSGQLLNRAGHNSVILCGKLFRRTSKDGSNLLCDKVDVILTDAVIIPFHAEIRFIIDGQEIDGNHIDARFLKYKDKLTDLFSQDIYYI